jgi:uncharacterized protein (DUF2252 family)
VEAKVTSAPVVRERANQPDQRFFKAKLTSPQERRAAGKALRDKTPREDHAGWKPPAGRPDPIDILVASNQGRGAGLVPIRHGRMLTSPFAFLRGSAAVMAADLAKTRASGLRVQACGDCHLLNFGAFATPERSLFFDINDFDETLPAPWEWDLKRLAASFVCAGRHIGLSDSDSARAVRTAVRVYREYMAQYAEMPVLQVWYDHIDLEETAMEMRGPKRRRRVLALIAKARQRGVVEHDFPKLVERDKGTPHIKDNPPLIYHGPRQQRNDFEAIALEALKLYRKSLPDHVRILLDHFKPVDFAVKVVGVGSVGTLCGIGLFMASDKDPLFLQIKQANASVLEAYAGKSAYPNHGQRVVSGQRLTQAASDIMLGWLKGKAGRHFYIRQLRDMKISATIEAMDASGLRSYARLCGQTLARAHARSGDPAMIAGYMGKSDILDQAIAKFAIHYADQTERDHKALAKAVRDGRLPAIEA